MNAATGVERVVRGLLEFLQSGTAPADLFGEAVFCDFSLPTWRVQASGRSDVIALRLLGHPGPSKVVGYRVQATPDGFVMELQERWSDAGGDWYCRECLLATVREGRISELSVYCTGDWSHQRQLDHARAVQLLRPDAGPGIDW